VTKGHRINQDPGTIGTMVVYARPILEVWVPGRPPDLHHGKHTTRWQRAAVTRERKAIVWALASGARHKAGLGPCGGDRRRLEVTVCWKGPRRDVINLLQDLKPDVDAMVKAGWLWDDSDKFLEWTFPPAYVVVARLQDVGIRYRVWPSTS
jgi:hypothetical protein